MKVKQVKDNTYCIDVGISYIPFYKLNENDIILIDSGEPGDRKLLESVFEKYDLNLKGILCSHGHPDHIGNNKYFKEKYGCIIAMPMYEAQICSSPINLKAYYNNNTLTEIINNYS